MQIHISRGKKLVNEFVKHIESTPNLFVYKFGNYWVPSNVSFPKATTATIINCNHEGVFNILSPHVFPNINRINYISTDPKSFDIYQRFKKTPEWVFPPKDLEFYKFIIGKGMGRTDSYLISNYLTNRRIHGTDNGFELSFHYDLNIPEYKIVDGEWYRDQFHEYCTQKQQELMDDNED